MKNKQLKPRNWNAVSAKFRNSAGIHEISKKGKRMKDKRELEKECELLDELACLEDDLVDVATSGVVILACDESCTCGDDCSLSCKGECGCESCMSNKPMYPWPDPKPLDLKADDFILVWECIKTWDINVPEVYDGYCGATGNHVMSILFATGKRNITEYLEE